MLQPAIKLQNREKSTIALNSHVVILKSDAKISGGLEKASTRIAQGFIQAGAKVSILTTAKSTDEHTYSTKIFPWPKFYKIEQFDRFAQQWVLEHKPDIVFG